MLQEEWNQPFDYKITSEPYDLVEYNPDLIGIGSVTSCFWQVLEFSELFRKELPKTKLVLGGHHITAMANALPLTVDVGVLGEGEDTFLDLVRRFKPGIGWTYNDLEKTPGICYRGRLGNVVFSDRREPRQDLDSLPFPARTTNPSNPDEAIIFTSRGCPFRCTYCSTQEYWERFRRFSADYVVRELEHIVETSPEVRSVYILDDLYVADRRRLREMAGLIAERGLNETLSFHGFVRSNLVDAELCELLKKMNASAIRFGAESGSDSVLQQMERGGKCSVRTHQNAIDLAHEHGLKCGASFMLGFPGETRDDLERTFDFIRRNDGKMFIEGLYLTVPLPGTELWQWAARQGLVNEQMDWRRLNLSFDNPDFDWDNFLYLNEHTLAKNEFIKAVLESGLLPEAVAWRGRKMEHRNLASMFMARVLKSLAEQDINRVAIYGAGQHTRRLLDDLNNAPVEVVGLLDDNELLHGTHMGSFKIHEPDSAHLLNAEAVIISSDHLEESLWAKRGRFESHGMTVRRLYGPESPATVPSCLI